MIFLIKKMGFLVSRLPDVAQRPGQIAVQGVEHREMNGEFC